MSMLQADVFAVLFMSLINLTNVVLFYFINYNIIIVYVRYIISSCNNVAHVTNLCLGRATTRSHSSQWSNKKVAVET